MSTIICQPETLNIVRANAKQQHTIGVRRQFFVKKTIDSIMYSLSFAHSHYIICIWNTKKELIDIELSQSVTFKHNAGRHISPIYLRFTMCIWNWITLAYLHFEFIQILAHFFICHIDVSECVRACFTTPDLMHHSVWTHFVVTICFFFCVKCDKRYNCNAIALAHQHWHACKICVFVAVSLAMLLFHWLV